MKVLVAHASRNGATRGIAERIAQIEVWADGIAHELMQGAASAAAAG